MTEAVEEYHDEETLTKVHRSLMSTGINEALADACIQNMQNSGILFRERTPTQAVILLAFESRGEQEAVVLSRQITDYLRGRSLPVTVSLVFEPVSQKILEAYREGLG